MKLLFKSKLIINSFDELNQNGFTGIQWPAPYIQLKIPVRITLYKLFFEKKFLLFSNCYFLQTNTTKQKFLTVQEYNSPLTFIRLLIQDNYILIARQDRAEFLRDYFTTKYKIPFYISLKMYPGLTGFPINKRLRKGIRLKLKFL